MVFAFVITLVLFVFGAVFGSFLNVVAMRTIEGESWLRGRSRCDECHHQLAWYDNIPLLSFLLLKGKCRYCSKPIASSHLLLEILTGLLFIWWWWGGFLFFQLTGQPFVVLQPLFWLVVGMILLLILVVDLKHLIIPDGAVIALTGITLIYRLVLIYAGLMQVKDFWQMIVATLVASLFFLGLWLITQGKGMGLGDVKLIIPLGLLLGWPRIIISLQLAFIIGAVGGILLVLMGKHRLKQPLPFGPFLILGSIIALLWGYQLAAWYLGLLGI